MKKIIVSLACVFMFSIKCMKPELRIEPNESGFLREYHDSEVNMELRKDEFFLPRTEQELNVVHESYLSSEYKSVFFCSIVANIEGELSARCKDGRIDLIDKYLGYMKVSFEHFLSFKDRDFSDAFFSHFEDDMSSWIIGTENLVEDPSNSFTRESLHLSHVIFEIASMLSQVPCLADRPSLFDEYSRLYLSDEYRQSSEYRERYIIVEKMLTEGISLGKE
ncbi:hypothetical protein FACS1894126_5830 [Alphaproteobacteria bacterium]|nr:hypothetical protein FACS1894126_5830 [Alphaproteobacteria bacterium]